MDCSCNAKPSQILTREATDRSGQMRIAFTELMLFTLIYAIILVLFHLQPRLLYILWNAEACNTVLR